MISLLVAMDKGNGIGHKNDLPWHLPNDLQHFKNLTLGKTIVMGRKTFDSIGRPLPNRDNVVLTRDKEFQADGVETIHSVEDIIKLYTDMDGYELFIIGGSELFKQMMPYADRMYVTHIDHTFEADTYFPEIYSGKWELVSSTKGVKDEKNPYDYYFKQYDRLSDN